MTEDERLPLTVLVPQSAGEPLEVIDEFSNIRISLVDRKSLSSLGEKWDSSGVYLLLDPVSENGTWAVYVGKASDLRSRVKQHVVSKTSWNRALLVRRDSELGFNDAHIAWLEVHLIQLLNASMLAIPSNKATPNAKLAAHDVHSLVNCATGITRTLRLLGYEPSAPSDNAHSFGDGVSKKKFFDVKTIQLLETGLLTAGESLTSLVSKWQATAIIEDSGRVLVGGTSFPSLSAAATRVKDGIETNGWEFWGAVRNDQLVPLAVIRAEFMSEV